MGELALVADFLNTADLERGTDRIDTGARLRAWLSEHLSDPGEMDAEAVARVRALREALRGLALANNGGELYPLDLATLNRAAAETGLRPRFTASGARLEPVAAGVEGAVGRLLADVFAAMATGSWERFKACARPSCRWAFIDETRNHSRTWCSMAVCGNRTKAARHRRNV